MAGKGCGRARGAVHLLFTAPLGLLPPPAPRKGDGLGEKRPGAGPANAQGADAPGQLSPPDGPRPPGKRIWGAGRKFRRRE